MDLNGNWPELIKNIASGVKDGIVSTAKGVKDNIVSAANYVCEHPAGIAKNVPVNALSTFGEGFIGGTAMDLSYAFLTGTDIQDIDYDQVLVDSLTGGTMALGMYGAAKGTVSGVKGAGKLFKKLGKVLFGYENGTADAGLVELQQTKVEKYTSDGVKQVLDDAGADINVVAKLTKAETNLTPEQETFIKNLRKAFKEPMQNTKMAKIVPESSIDNFLTGADDYDTFGGFVSVYENSKKLKTLAEQIEGFRLDYKGTAFDAKINKVYGKIVYKYDEKFKVIPPSKPATSENFPYTGRGYTGTDTIVLPEWIQSARKFADGDLFEIHDSLTGEVKSTYFYQDGKWLLQ